MAPSAAARTGAALPRYQITVPAALLPTLTTLELVRRWRPATLLTAAGAACTAATVAIWARFNEPVNRELVEWQADALPADWERRRDQWEFAHAASAAFHTVSLAVRCWSLPSAMGLRCNKELRT